MFDNKIFAQNYFVADNRGNAMKLYECDFRGLKEYLCDDVEGERRPLPLGNFLCRLLSTNYENASESISSFLLDNRRNGCAFPAEQLQELVNELCGTSEFDEMRDMASVLRDLYEIGETQEVITVYGSLEDSFSLAVFEYFKVAVTLQAYLEESEHNSEMSSAINFERFINGFLDMQIKRNEQALSLSEYNFSSDIFLGSDIKGIVRDVFSNLIKFSDDFSVFDLISFDSFLVTTIYYFFLNGFIFKRCKNCGRFFVPFSRSDEMYCNNISPQDETRTCKEYGSQKLWYDKVKNDEVAKLSRNIYSAKQMLVRRNPDIQGYKDMFEFFKAERKKWEALVKSGEKTREEYIAWLNEIKSRKTLK